MGYLLTEIVVYLVIAGLIGFAFGWAVRAGVLDSYFDKFVAFIKKIGTAIKGLFSKSKSSETNETVSFGAKDDKKISSLSENKEEVKKEVTEDVKKSEEAKSVEAVVIATELIKEDFKDTLEEIAPVKIAEKVKEEVQVEEPIAADIKEVVAETVVEVTTPTETVEPQEDIVKPTLLTEAPETGADKLSTIKGIGPVLEKKLNELGVYSFEQIASWDAEQELWIGTKMAFPKKVTKEEWVKQAKELLNAK